MFFLFLFICLTFAIGSVLILVGIFSKTNKQLTKIGLFTVGLPIGLMIVIAVFGSAIDLFKHQPSFEELVGEYEIVDATNLSIDKTSYDQYELILRSDSTFTLTRTPYIDLCESGKYKVDYLNDYNEIAFQCGGYHMAHIDRGFRSHRIEFIIGDPDSGESIYFGKKTNKH